MHYKKVTKMIDSGMNDVEISAEFESTSPSLVRECRLIYERFIKLKQQEVERDIMSIRSKLNG